MVIPKIIIRPFGVIGIPKFRWMFAGLTPPEVEKIREECEGTMRTILHTVGEDTDPNLIMNLLRGAAVFAGADWAKCECYKSPVRGDYLYIVTFGKLGTSTKYEFAVGTKLC